MEMNEATRSRIEETLASDEVVLFMKGRRRMPQCGFSAQVVSVLDQMLEEYTTVNVLTDSEIREGIKTFSNWPTIPQLYVKGKFIGGCDIVVEMFEQGELQDVLGVEVPEVAPPKITVTDRAAQAFAQALGEGGEGAKVRLTIDARFRQNLGVDGAGPLDLVVESNGISLVVDRGTAQRSDGTVIDFVEGTEGGFRIDNPHEPPKVRAITPRQLADRMKAEPDLLVYDVRTQEERDVASLAGTTLMTPEEQDKLQSLDKDTPIVFHCHHGGRSQAAAEHFLGQGFSQVFNLTGGIDAWSRDVDDSIPRY